MRAAGEAEDPKGVIEADGLYKYVYYGQYIEKINQQLRNESAKASRETPLSGISVTNTETD